MYTPYHVDPFAYHVRSPPSLTVFIIAGVDPVVSVIFTGFPLELPTYISLPFIDVNAPT